MVPFIFNYCPTLSFIAALASRYQRELEEQKGLVQNQQDDLTNLQSIIHDLQQELESAQILHKHCAEEHAARVRALMGQIQGLSTKLTEEQVRSAALEKSKFRRTLERLLFFVLVSYT